LRWREVMRQEFTEVDQPAAREIEEEGDTYQVKERYPLSD